MLPMTLVIVDYTFKNVFLTFYIRQAGPLKRREACDNLSLYSPSRWDSALIYALINALKKLTHCVNALKKINALTALIYITFCMGSESSN